MMKNIFAICLILLLLVACTKKNNTVLLDEATITILHSTCVKTIVKIDAPNTNIGTSWSNNLLVNPVLHKQVIQVGDVKNAPVTGFEISKQYKVRIYSKATGPDVICAMVDEVNSPDMTYDIEILP